MILTELVEYITKKRTISRAQLAQRFAMSEDGVDAMLEVWIKKGKISRTVDTNKQGETIRVRYNRNADMSLSITTTM